MYWFTYIPRDFPSIFISGFFIFFFMCEPSIASQNKVKMWMFSVSQQQRLCPCSRSHKEGVTYRYLQAPRLLAMATPSAPVKDHERRHNRVKSTHSLRCHSGDSSQTLWRMFRDCECFDKSQVPGPIQRWEGSATQQVSRMLTVTPTCNKLRWSSGPMRHFSKFCNCFKLMIMHWPGLRHTPVAEAQETCAYRAGTWVGGPGHRQASEWLFPA